MNLDKSHIAVGIISALVIALVQFLSFGATYGRLTTSVEQLEKRVDKLEDKGAPGTKVGDLCLKMMDAQIGAFRSGNKTTRAEIEAQLQKLGCYDDVPAAMTGDANASEAVDQNSH